MDEADKKKVIKSLRSIVDVTIQTIQILEGTRAPSLATARPEDELVEALSRIEDNLGKIHNLNIE